MASQSCECDSALDWSAVLDDGESSASSVKEPALAEPETAPVSGAAGNSEDEPPPKRRCKTGLEKQYWSARLEECAAEALEKIRVSGDEQPFVLETVCSGMCTPSYGLQVRRITALSLSEALRIPFLGQWY